MANESNPILNVKITGDKNATAALNGLIGSFTKFSSAISSLQTDATKVEKIINGLSKTISSGVSKAFFREVKGKGSIAGFVKSLADDMKNANLQAINAMKTAKEVEVKLMAATESVIKTMKGMDDKISKAPAAMKGKKRVAGVRGGILADMMDGAEEKQAMTMADFEKMIANQLPFTRLKKGDLQKIVTKLKSNKEQYSVLQEALADNNRAEVAKIAKVVTTSLEKSGMTPEILSASNYRKSKGDLVDSIIKLSMADKVDPNVAARRKHLLTKSMDDLRSQLSELKLDAFAEKQKKVILNAFAGAKSKIDAGKFTQYQKDNLTNKLNNVLVSDMSAGNMKRAIKAIKDETNQEIKAYSEIEKDFKRLSAQKQRIVASLTNTFDTGASKLPNQKFTGGREAQFDSLKMQFLTLSSGGVNKSKIQSLLRMQKEAEMLKLQELSATKDVKKADLIEGLLTAQFKVQGGYSNADLAKAKANYEKMTMDQLRTQMNNLKLGDLVKRKSDYIDSVFNKAMNQVSASKLPTTSKDMFSMKLIDIFSNDKMKRSDKKAELDKIKMAFDAEVNKAKEIEKMTTKIQNLHRQVAKKISDVKFELPNQKFSGKNDKKFSGLQIEFSNVLNDPNLSNQLNSLYDIRDRLTSLKAKELASNRARKSKVTMDTRKDSLENKLAFLEPVTANTSFQDMKAFVQKKYGGDIKAMEKAMVDLTGDSKMANLASGVASRRAKFMEKVYNSQGIIGVQTGKTKLADLDQKLSQAGTIKSQVKIIEQETESLKRLVSSEKTKQKIETDYKRLLLQAQGLKIDKYFDPAYAAPTTSRGMQAESKRISNDINQTKTIIAQLKRRNLDEVTKQKLQAQLDVIQGVKAPVKTVAGWGLSAGSIYKALGGGGGTTPPGGSGSPGAAGSGGIVPNAIGNLIGSFDQLYATVKSSLPHISEMFQSFGAGVVRSISILSGWMGKLTLATMGMAAAFVGVGYMIKDFGTNIIFTTEKMRGYNIALLGMMKNQTDVDQLIAKSQKVARDFPVSFEQVFSTTKALSLISPLKPLLSDAENSEKTLKSLWTVVSSLQQIEPEWGLQGAVFSLREALSGDMLSLKRRFEVPVNLITSVDGKKMTEMKNDPAKMLTTLANYFEEVLGTDALKLASQQFGIVLSKIEGLWFQFQVKIGESGFYDKVVKDMQKLNDILETALNAPEMRKLTRRISDALSMGYDEVVRGLKGTFGIIGDIVGVDLVSDDINKQLGSMVSALEYYVKIFSGMVDFVSSPKTKKALIGLFEDAVAMTKEASKSLVDFVTDTYNFFASIVKQSDTFKNKLKDTLGISGEQAAKGILFLYLFGPGNALTLLTSSFMTITTLAGGIGMALKSSMLMGTASSVSSLAAVLTVASNLLKTVTMIAVGIGSWLLLLYGVQWAVDRFYNSVSGKSIWEKIFGTDTSKYDDGMNKIKEISNTLKEKNIDVLGGTNVDDLFKATPGTADWDNYAKILNRITTEQQKIKDMSYWGQFWAIPADLDLQQLKDKIIEIGKLKEKTDWSAESDRERSFANSLPETKVADAAQELVGKLTTGEITIGNITEGFKNFLGAVWDSSNAINGGLNTPLENTIANVEYLNSLLAPGKTLKGITPENLVRVEQIAKAIHLAGGAGPDITSLVRTKEEAKALGNENSAHVGGNAVDYTVGGMSTSRRMEPAFYAEMVKNAIHYSDMILFEQKKGEEYWNRAVLKRLDEETGGKVKLYENEKSTKPHIHAQLGKLADGTIANIMAKVSVLGNEAMNAIANAPDKKIPESFDTKFMDDVKQKFFDGYKKAFGFWSTKPIKSNLDQRYVEEYLSTDIDKLARENQTDMAMFGKPALEKLKTEFTQKAQAIRSGGKFMDDAAEMLSLTAFPAFNFLRKMPTPFLSVEKQAKEVEADAKVAEGRWKNLTEKTYASMANAFDFQYFRGFQKDAVAAYEDKFRSEFIMATQANKDMPLELRTDVAKALQEIFKEMDAGVSAEESIAKLRKQMELTTDSIMTLGISAEGINFQKLFAGVQSMAKNVPLLSALIDTYNQFTEAKKESQPVDLQYNADMEKFSKNIKGMDLSRLREVRKELYAIDRARRQEVYAGIQSRIVRDNATPGESFQFGMESAVIEWKTWAEEVFDIGKELVGNLTSTFETNFFDVLTGKMKSLEDTFQNVGNSIRDMIMKVVSRMLALSATKIVLGIDMNANGSINGVSGGLLGPIFQKITGMGQGGTGGGSTSSLPTNMIPMFAGNASVGTQAATRAAMIASGAGAGVSGIPGAVSTGLGMAVGKAATAKTWLGGIMDKAGAFLGTPAGMATLGLALFSTQPGRLFGGTKDNTAEGRAAYDSSMSTYDKMIGKSRSAFLKYSNVPNFDVAQIQAPVGWETKSGDGWFRGPKTKSYEHDETAMRNSILKYYEDIKKVAAKHYEKELEISRLKETNNLKAMNMEFENRERYLFRVHMQLARAEADQDWDKVDDFIDTIGTTTNELAQMKDAIQAVVEETGWAAKRYEILSTGGSEKLLEKLEMDQLYAQAAKFEKNTLEWYNAQNEILERQLSNATNLIKLSIDIDKKLNESIATLYGNKFLNKDYSYSFSRGLGQGGGTVNGNYMADYQNQLGVQYAKLKQVEQGIRPAGYDKPLGYRLKSQEAQYDTGYYQNSVRANILNPGTSTTNGAPEFIKTGYLKFGFDQEITEGQATKIKNKDLTVLDDLFGTEWLDHILLQINQTKQSFFNDLFAGNTVQTLLQSMDDVTNGISEEISRILKEASTKNLRLSNEYRITSLFKSQDQMFSENVGLIIKQMDAIRTQMATHAIGTTERTDLDAMLADLESELTGNIETMAGSVREWLDSGLISVTRLSGIKWSDPIEKIIAQFDSISAEVDKKSFNSSILESAKELTTSEYNDIVKQVGNVNADIYGAPSRLNMNNSMAVMSKLYPTVGNAIRDTGSGWDAWYNEELSKIKERLKNTDTSSDKFYQAQVDLFNLMKERADHLKQKAEDASDSMEDMLGRIEETMRARIAEEAKTKKGDVYFVDVGQTRDAQKMLAELMERVKTNDPEALKLLEEFKKKMLGISR